MAGMLICTLILGPLALWVIVKAINYVSYVFTFPALPVAGFTSALLIIQILLTLYTMRAMQKESLIESIAENE